MRIKKEPKEIWDEYLSGVAYNNAIELYDNVEDNENFVIGNQWEGVAANDIEKPVLNIMKRPVAYYTATICSEDVGYELVPFVDDDEEERILRAVSRELDRVIENDRTIMKMRKSVRNACVDGDGALYFYWDPDIKTGSKAEGDIRSEIIENINVIFGNPHDRTVQTQPYILIALRKPVAEVRDEAIENGLSKLEAEEIIPDKDQKQGEKGDENDLVTVLVKFWKEKGYVHVSKTTEKHVIRKEWEPKYTLYPLVWYQVDEVRKSYHGQAIVTGMIPNQIAINKLFAMYLRSVRMNAFPKTVIDKQRFPNGWSNAVGEVIEVNGGGVIPVRESFEILRGGDVSPQVMEVIQTAITLTKECIGATESALGEINAERAAASAIVATMQATQAPLEIPHRDYFEACEDMTRILIDMMTAHYGKRPIKIEKPAEEIDETNNEKTNLAEFDFSTLADRIQNINIRVGSSAYWSELAQMQTMDNLLTNGIIQDAVIYLESIPDKWLPNKQDIINSIKQQQTMASIDPGMAQINPNVGQQQLMDYDAMLG